MSNSITLLNIILTLITLTTWFDCVSEVCSLNIKQAKNKTKLGLSETYEVIENECREIIIPNNFKKLVLNLESDKLSRVLITDKRVEKCDETEELSKCCSRNSTFCIDNVNPTKNDFRLNYCIDFTYLYACNFGQKSLENNTTLNSSEIAKNTSEPVKSSIYLATSVVKGQGCHTTEFIAETACSSIGLVSCKDPQKCTSDCSYVECRKDLGDATSRVFATCLPSKLTNEDITNRCKNHVAFEKSAPQVFKLTCDKKDETYIPDKSSHSFFKLLMIIMGVLILVIFISSVYYRFKMGIDGIPPFDPPSFAPNFIFPRQTPY